MKGLDIEKIEKYLSTLYGKAIKITSITQIGKEKTGELKGFGYGKPLIIELRGRGIRKKIVLETMAANTFGHDHFADRAQILLWEHATFNKLPHHVRSIDVGAFTPQGDIISVGDGEEFFILTEFVEGVEYHRDLERIFLDERLGDNDKDRAKALAEYLVTIHSLKQEAPHLYTRRIRDLIGHGECIMGLIDNYRGVDPDLLREIELECVKWRWKIRDKGHRLSQVHGDFHPWNVIFREGLDYTVLDRARGEWGEPGDDVSSMTINYLFFSLQKYGELKGPFEILYKTFWNTYMAGTGDYEILKVIQPFLAWRGLVLANPLWYPTISHEVREKIFNLIRTVLSVEEFMPEGVNEYLR